MIIQSERLFEDKVETMNQVAEFLGLEPFEFQTAAQLGRSWDAGVSDSARRPQPYDAMDTGLRKTLARFFDPNNKKLYRLIGEGFGWS